MQFIAGNGMRNSRQHQPHFMAGLTRGVVPRVLSQHKELAMTALEPFEVVARRYCVDPDDAPDVTTISMQAFLNGDDPKHVFSYLSSLGLHIRSAQDVLLVNELQDEEELSAELCADGVLIGHASDGWFLAVTP